MKPVLYIAMLGVGAALLLGATPYHKKVDRELSEWNAKVETLRARSQKAGESTRQTLEKDTEEIQTKLNEARRTLDHMVATGSEKSKPVRHNLNQALKEIRELYRKAASRFKSSRSKEKSQS
jgi:predicted transcriptional regulator